jgi:hypothetical protein
MLEKVVDNGYPKLTSTLWTLSSWLDDWARGIDIHGEMFGPPATKSGINPLPVERMNSRDTEMATY